MAAASTAPFPSLLRDHLATSLKDDELNDAVEYINMMVDNKEKTPEEMCEEVRGENRIQLAVARASRHKQA